MDVMISDSVVGEKKRTPLKNIYIYINSSSFLDKILFLKKTFMSR